MKVNTPSNAVAATGAAKSLRSPIETKQPEVAGKKESVGDIANRVANSAGFAPGRAVKGTGNPQLDKDAFFKLMLTHIKNQDPTSPLKSHEMAAQLAQFSSLEQMSNIKDILGEMNKGQGASNQYQALDLIGKTVSGDSSKIDRVVGDKAHPVSFALSEPAQEVKISIKDAEGKVVKSIEMQGQPKGNVKFEWDGKDIEGRELKAGSYKVSVDAKSTSGSKVPVDMQFKGQVTGIQFTEKGPIVFIGNKQVPLKEIKQIALSEEKNSAQAMMGSAAQKAQSSLAAQKPTRILSPEQLSPDQQKGLEQALASLKGSGANPLSDPTQDVLATAVHNQNMKNQKL